MNTPATIPHIARALDGGFAAINARLDALEKRIGKPVVWPIPGLRKDHMSVETRRNIAGDRQIASEGTCEVCQAKPLLFDYEYRKATEQEQRVYRCFTMCPNGHLGEF